MPANGHGRRGDGSRARETPVDTTTEEEGASQMDQGCTSTRGRASRRSAPERFGPLDRLPSFAWLTCLLVGWLLAAGGANAGATGAPAPLALDSLPAEARGEAIVESDGPQLRARLLVTEAGDTTRVGVLFDLAPGWHIYWRNPGGTGLPPRLGLSVPGRSVGEVVWPAPRTFAEADGLFTTWGYEGRVLLSAPLDDARSDATADEGMITADVHALACRTQCVPATFTLRSPLAPALSAPDRATIERLFADSLAQAPIRAAEAGLRAHARWHEAPPALDGTATATLSIEADRCTRAGAGAGDACPRIAVDGDGALFVPMEGETFELAAAALREQDPARGRATLSIEATRLEDGADRLHGLVPFRSADGRLRHVEFDVAIEPTTASAAAGPASAAGVGPAAGAGRTWADWLRILGLALLGGLVLNGMPCVLPVLAIKVVAVADLAEKDPADVRHQGIAYTVGVLGSMAALAGVVVALRAAGQSVGWGFQFQEPLFVAAIAAVLVAFALNLFGVFEIELGQGRLATIGQQATGWRRSLFEGLLAVVLATPCTAPFLGTAVGFAFASHAGGILAIFAAIGLGLASPFLVVSFVPAFARYIPKSGPWMNTLRAGLGFSLLATVVWLLWVLGQSGGVDAVVATTGVLLGLAFLLWGFGCLQPLRSPWLGRAGVVAIAGAATLGFNLIELEGPTDARPGVVLETGAAHADATLPWTPEAVDAALAEGRPVFVVFTADWCITCQVNERTVLERAAVRDAFARGGYVRFVADWTRRDETIRKTLAEFGRAGVPLYLLYSPERPDAPRVLSELLSVDEVVTALDAAAPTRRG